MFDLRDGTVLRGAEQRGHGKLLSVVDGAMILEEPTDANDLERVVRAFDATSGPYVGRLDATQRHATQGITGKMLARARGPERRAHNE